MDTLLKIDTTWLLLAAALILCVQVAISSRRHRRTKSAGEKSLAELRAFRNQLDARTHELQGTEAKMSAIIDGAVDGIVSIDSAGIIESYNPAAESMFGYRIDEVLGKNISCLMPEKEADEHDAHLARYLQTGHRKVVGISREVRGQRKDGTTFPMMLAVSEIDVGQKKIFTGIVRDITDHERTGERMEFYAERLAKMNRSLSVAYEEANAANETKSEFLANISHELRTPLHAILSFARFGIDEHATAEHEEILDYFQKIDQSGETLLALVNDLLDLAKLESSKTVLDQQPHGVNTLISTVVDEFRSLCSEKDIKVTCEQQDSSSVVACDGEKIKQVIRNLLSNASKFSPASGTIHIAGRQENNVYQISVRDQGPGIPEDELETVFDKFIQSSETRTGAGGTGLGLAICREIVAAHQGKIWAENGPQGGAVFTFEIPTEPASADVAKPIVPTIGSFETTCLNEPVM